ncbi:hypothetical protein A9Q95_03455 [Rhodobacterales bacterium 59_46_T64]|nr:hypothetical protein A9Q95_03455 [Rhodobacterales bacterium 59_46_T64]
MFDILVLVAAGFVAGILNAVAGGGTFLTFPALVYVGLPVVTANATATLAALPGYLGSAYAFRREVQTEGPMGLKAIVITAAIGGVLGGGLLLVTSNDLFSGLVPWLLLLATVLFGAGPWILRQLKKRGAGQAGVGISTAAVFAVSLYGGYFNGGLGIILLATFGMLGYVNIHGMNGIKTLLSAVISVVATVAFIAAGLIAWQEAAVMMVSSAAGGYVGAQAARRITRTDLLRWGIVAIGAATTLIFFLK